MNFPIYGIINYNISQWEGLSHILWNIKHVPNHQPDLRYPFFIAIRWRSWLGFNHPPTRASPASPQKSQNGPWGSDFFGLKVLKKYGYLVFTVFCDKSRWLRVEMLPYKLAELAYWCVLRREWMGCWGLLGWLLIVSQWIIPSFPTFSTSKFVVNEAVYYPLVNVYMENHNVSVR